MLHSSSGSTLSAKIQSSGTKVHLHLGIISCDPLICIMNHFRSILSNQMEEFICIKKVKFG